ncbi:MAG: YraN family protein, partial [Bacteroidetes bacterium]
MATIHELGRRGEELAAQYLLEKGYKILETNWR